MRRVAAALLLLVLVPAAPARAAGPPVPVILVGAAAGPACFGVPAAGARPQGLYARLLDAGYVPGETLFALEWPPGARDPARDASYLATLAHEVLAKTGGERLNLIGYSLGGLAVCHYLMAHGGDGHVDTAVLVATPLAGSFLATHYRVQWEVLRQEALARGGFPWLGVPDLATLPTDGPEPAFTSEAAYVAARARWFYAPLYGEYVLESRWLGVPGVQPFAAAFEVWLARSRPEVFARNLVQAVEPPLGWGAEAVPGPGQDLSRGFYEWMALASGRRLYLMEKTGLGDLVREVLGDGYVPTDVRDAVRHYGTRLALALGGLVLKASRAGWLQGLLAKLGDRAGLEPEGAALRRVLQVALPVPGVEQSGGPGPAAVPVNAWLARWLEWRRRATGPRLVLAAASLPNLWRPLITGAGSNDLAVETEAALVCPGPGDSLRVWTGVLGPNHLTLLDRADVQEYIVRELTAAPAPARSHRPLAARTPYRTWSWQESGHVRTSSWRPTYVEVLPDRLAGVAGEGAIELDLPTLPAGWQWLVGVSGTTLMAPAGAKTRVPLAGFPASSATVSIRPVPAAGVGGLERELVRNVGYRVVFSAGVDAEPAPGPAPAVAPGPEPVRVQLVTKRTTARKESRTYHQRWVWDLGDGSVREYDDARLSAVTVRHTYYYPGTYRVQATAYDNHGRVLRHLTWTHRVEGGPETAEFSAESIVEPQVRVEVRGPSAWIVGRPAVFHVEVEVEPVAGLRRELVSIDPGPRFEVVWERPGRFTVQAAAVVRLVYEFPERTITVTNTYIGACTLEVLGTVLDD